MRPSKIKVMKSASLITLLTFLSIQLANAQTKALVGGTLIDGYGGHPIHNSVIIVEGERIVKV